jgi:hypothetical protein
MLVYSFVMILKESPLYDKCCSVEGMPYILKFVTEDLFVCPILVFSTSYITLKLYITLAAVRFYEPIYSKIKESMSIQLV